MPVAGLMELEPEDPTMEPMLDNGNTARCRDGGFGSAKGWRSMRVVSGKGRGMTLKEHSITLMEPT